MTAGQSRSDGLGSSAPESLRLVDTRQAARLLSVSVRTLWNLRARGELRCVRLGARKLRYRLSDIRHLIRAASADSVPACREQSPATGRFEAERPSG
jgi:excisionase family DNA binding protein